MSPISPSSSPTYTFNSPYYLPTFNNMHPERQPFSHFHAEKNFFKKDDTMRINSLSNISPLTLTSSELATSFNSQPSPSLSLTSSFPSYSSSGSIMENIQKDYRDHKCYYQYNDSWCSLTNGNYSGLTGQAFSQSSSDVKSLPVLQYPASSKVNTPTKSPSSSLTPSGSALDMSEEALLTLDLWWKESPHAEKQFRTNLSEQQPFLKKFADHSSPEGYRKGNNRGGGGQSGSRQRARSKTYKFNQTRPF